MAERALHVNVALQQAGLIDLDQERRVTAWRAFAWTAGGSAAIVLQDPADAALRERVGTVVRRLADDPANGIARLVEGVDLETLGGFPTATFVLGLEPGFRTGSGVTGDLVRPVAAGGNHGYLQGPRDMEASFFLVGPGVRAGRNLGGIDMRDVAPTLAARLGVSLSLAQGRDAVR